LRDVACGEVREEGVRDVACGGGTDRRVALRYGAAMGTRHADAPGGPRAGGLPPWAWAVLVSLAAHALLFVALLVVRLPTLQLPVTPPPDAPPKPTVFRVGVWSPTRPAEGAPAPSAPAATPRGPVKPPAAPVADSPSSTPAQAEQTSPPVVEAAGTADGPPAGSEPAAPERTGGESSAPGGGPAEGSAASTVGAGGTTPTSGDAVSSGAGSAGPGADVVGLVHARLAAGAERCYPAAARRYQQRGTAEVRFCVDASGLARETSLVKPSGSSLLDAAVGDCVLPAASPFPASAQGHCFTVPVRFGAK